MLRWLILIVLVLAVETAWVLLGEAIVGRGKP